MNLLTGLTHLTFISILDFFLSMVAMCNLSLLSTSLLLPGHILLFSKASVLTFPDVLVLFQLPLGQGKR